jgi:hypothetical protein
MHKALYWIFSTLKKEKYAAVALFHPQEHS